MASEDILKKWDVIRACIRTRRPVTKKITCQVWLSRGRRANASWPSLKSGYNGASEPTSSCPQLSPRVRVETLVWRGDDHDTVWDLRGYLWQEGPLDPDIKGGWGILAEVIAAPWAKVPGFRGHGAVGKARHAAVSRGSMIHVWAFEVPGRGALTGEQEQAQEQVCSRERSFWWQWPKGKIDCVPASKLWTVVTVAKAQFCFPMLCLAFCLFSVPYAAEGVILLEYLSTFR